MAIEADILTAVRTQVAELDPAPSEIREAFGRVEDLPDGAVQLVPTDLQREAGSQLGRKWHLVLVCAVAKRMGPAGGGETAWAELLDRTRALLDLIDGAAFRQEVLDAGAYDLRRGNVAYWSKPGGEGTPCGAMFTLTIDFNK